MLSDIEFDAYCAKHSVSQAARDYIETTRNSDPSRLVGTNARHNVCGRFASRKMGAAIQTESRTAEFVFAVECEYSPHVLEFWDQPPPIPIQKLTPAGKRRAASYTPDYLLLSDSGPEVIEVKARSKLGELVSTNPNWTEVEGVYRYCPGHKFFQSIGLPHRVVFPEATSQIVEPPMKALGSAQPKLSRTM